MIKHYISVQNFPNSGMWATLRSGVAILLFSISSTVEAVPTENYKIQEKAIPERVVTISPTHGSSSNTVDIYGSKSFTPTYKAEQAYVELCSRDKGAEQLRDVFNFIVDGLGNDFEAERVSVDCDSENAILNITYRLLNNVFISITKPKETMGDENVVVGVSDLHNQLVSDIVTIDFLSTYIHNLETRRQELP